jgi:hypothetical protein
VMCGGGVAVAMAAAAPGLVADMVSGGSMLAGRGDSPS